MDEFLNNNLNDEIREETVPEDVKAPKAEESVATEEPKEDTTPLPQEEATQDDTIENAETFTPVYNPINYSPVNPVVDYKPMSTGLKIFSLILVAIIALTSTCLAGYFIGNGKTVKPNLAARPKKTDEMTAAQVYEEVNKSVVGITVYNTEGNGGQASGIVYSKNGYIVTNDHIYAEVPNAKFKIHTHDGKEYNAKYVAGDLISDLAVLKIENSELTPAVFGNSDELYMGQNVVAIGRPNDATDTSSITKGIISALNRRVKNSSNYSARLIQTDTPINPGSSGGALVNMYGQVVGVTASKLASVEYEGVGYAIPTTVMKRIVDELIEEGKVVSRAKLGITYTAINSVLAEINKSEHTGLLVATVSNDSDLYGKIGEGDMITKINGTPISEDDMVLDIIENCKAGDKITVTVITTDNEEKTFEAELKANIGESSYTTQSSKNNSSDSPSSGGGTFDFPFGE